MFRDTQYFTARALRDLPATRPLTLVHSTKGTKRPYLQCKSECADVEGGNG